MSIDGRFGDGGSDATERNDGEAMRLGVAYEHGPNAASLVYHHGSSEAVVSEIRIDF